MEKGSFILFTDIFKIGKLFWNQNRYVWGVKEKEKKFNHSLWLWKIFLEFFKFGAKGVFLNFYWTFVDWETVLELQLEYLGGQRKGSNKFDYSLWLLGVKEKEKINSTTLCGFKNVFWVFPIFGEKGVFFGFLLDFFEI